MAKVTEKEAKNDEIGTRIKKLRKEKGWTQAELIEQIENLAENKDKSRNEKHIGYIENGTRPLSPEYAFLLAKVFNVRVEYLLGNDKYKTEAEETFYLLSNGINSARNKVVALDTLISQTIEKLNCSTEFNDSLKSFDEYQRLRSEITDFIEFKVSRIAERGKNNGKHTGAPG